MNWIKKLLGTLSAEEMTRIARENAAIGWLEHEIAAEHHAALAVMYRERAQRLTKRLPVVKATAEFVKATAE